MGADTGSAPTDRPVEGSVAPGWEGIRDVFVENGSPSGDDPGDHGAALCVIRAGEVVVDLAGGWRDHAGQVPFARDTLVNSYSVGKALTSAVALAAVTRGLVDLDEPVRTYWPDFPSDATLRQHLAHQGGLPAVREPLTDDVALDWRRMCAALAATEPWWEPGAAHGYHTNTFGFVVGEPVRAAADAARQAARFAPADSDSDGH